MAQKTNVTIDQLTQHVEDLLQQGQIDGVGEYLNAINVDRASLDPYVIWNDKCYTRNLIFKSEQYELLALCWQVGNRSWIHNHRSEYCWMMVVEGTLGVDNYVRRGCCQENRTVELETTDQLVLQEGSCQVNPKEPIHVVYNYGDEKPAISLHFYSRPFEECVVYDTEQGLCRDISLFYTSEFGKPNEVVAKKKCCSINDLPLKECTLCPQGIVDHCGGTVREMENSGAQA